MEKTKFFFISVFLIFLFQPVLLSQDINVHKYIGKTKREVIKKYGKPVYQDNSNPAMICTFYQTKTKRLVFVSDKKGVYQAEAYASYYRKVKARSVIDAFILRSFKDGFKIDTVSTNDFQIHKKGISADLRLVKNKTTKKYEVSVKARKYEN